MITHIRRGNKNATHAPKLKNRHVGPRNAQLWESSIIALLFAIYQDDMVEDYGALNREEKSQ